MGEQSGREADRTLSGTTLLKDDRDQQQRSTYNINIATTRAGAKSPTSLITWVRVMESKKHAADHARTSKSAKGVVGRFVVSVPGHRPSRLFG